MDKYEYKVRADEIRELIAEEDYAQAAEIADTIDWRRVKSVMMLCTISDLYKMNRRYEDARNMLLLAYERRPGGKTICYSLCELYIKTEEFLQAVNYYKEFVQVAPKDPGRYILQYKLYEAQEVSLEERIHVLEELKNRDYREKWAYELAYLYHRVGLATRCVEECDELIVWFGEGKYVIKAMELKMLHQPLSESQQEKYNRRFEPAKKVTGGVHGGSAAENARPGRKAPAQHAGMEQYVEAGQYTEAEQYIEPGQYAETGEYAEAEQYAGAGQYAEAEQYATPVHPGWAAQGPEVTADTRTDWVLSTPPQPGKEVLLPHPTEPPKPEELDIQVKTMDMGAYNTINLQAEIAAGLQEVLLEDEPQPDASAHAVVAPLPDPDTESLDLPEIDEVDENDLEPEQEIMESSEVFFGETGEILSAESPASPDLTAEIVMKQMRAENMNRREAQVLAVQPPKELAGVLSQESDGQLSLVVPESEKVEKQITGQMNFGDFLNEWEKIKQENTAKRQEEVRQHVLQQTGNLFTEFEESVKDGLLEQLENEPGDLTEHGLSEADAYAEPMEESAEFNEAAFEETELSEADPCEELTEESVESDGEASAETEPPEAEASEESGEEDSEFGGEASAEAEPIEGDAYAEASEEQDASSDQQEAAGVRALTREEKELYAPFIQSRAGRERLIKAIDSISLAAYTGNVIITAEKGIDTIPLAKGMICEIQMSDSNFTGRAAKVSGQSLNTKNVEETLRELEGGALIIQTASQMEPPTVETLQKVLQRENFGIIVFLEDTKKAMEKLLAAYPKLQESFTARMDVEAMSNDSLVAFGRHYAREMEYAIDELGILALHTRIEERQTMEHVVSAIEVKEMVDTAIRHANKKNLPHFFDILLGKRYDEEDMIILTEKDFA